MPKKQQMQYGSNFKVTKQEEPETLQDLLQSDKHLCNSCGTKASEGCWIYDAFDKTANATIGTNLVFHIVNCEYYYDKQEDET